VEFPVSDENRLWMLYVYKQFTEADPHAQRWIGVNVDLYIVDANANARPLATTTGAKTEPLLLLGLLTLLAYYLR
jgi:hypothetical protein